MEDPFKLKNAQTTLASALIPPQTRNCPFGHWQTKCPKPSWQAFTYTPLPPQTDHFSKGGFPHPKYITNIKIWKRQKCNSGALCRSSSWWWWPSVQSSMWWSIFILVHFIGRISVQSTMKLMIIQGHWKGCSNRQWLNASSVGGKEIVISIPDICLFWYTATLLRPEKSTPKSA